MSKNPNRTRLKNAGVQQNKIMSPLQKITLFYRKGRKEFSQSSQWFVYVMFVFALSLRTLR